MRYDNMFYDGRFGQTNCFAVAVYLVSKIIHSASFRAKRFFAGVASFDMIVMCT